MMFEQDKNEVVYNGRTRGELETAFGKVERKENWKLPINAIVSESDVKVVNDAVAFYTGEGLSLSVSVGEGKFLVKARGYYEVVGA